MLNLIDIFPKMIPSNNFDLNDLHENFININNLQVHFSEMKCDKVIHYNFTKIRKIHSS